METFDKCDKRTDSSINDPKIRELLCKLENIIDVWDTISEILRHGGIINTKFCDFLIYWLYDKLKDINFSVVDVNNLYTKFRKKLNSDATKGKCFNFINEEYYRKYVKAYDKNVIKNKKELYEFLDYYNLIKSKLNSGTKNRDQYCNYIKYIFGVYTEMYNQCNSKGLKIYYKELTLFDDIFKKKNEELQFVEKNCPNRCLNLVFKANNKNLCPSTKEKPKESVQESTKPFKIPKTEDFLKDLALYKLYEALYTSYDFDDDTFICKSIQGKASYSRDFRFHCNNLKFILDNWKNLHDIFETHFDQKELCNYLNYWLHEKIVGHPFRKNISKLLLTAWDFMKPNNSNGVTCLPKKFHVSEKQFKKKKKLYDFLGYYKSISNILKTGQTLNVEQYCDYIKNNFGLYYVMENEDKCSNSSVYKDELASFKNLFSNELDTLKSKCPGKYLELFFEKEKTRKIANLPYGLETSLQSGSPLPTEGVKTSEGQLLQELPSYKKYAELNESENIDNYCDDCNDILPLEKDNPGIYELCKKAVKNLYEVIKKGECNEWGEYFAYWINDEKQKIINEHQKNIFENPIVKLDDVAYRVMNRLDHNDCRYFSSYAVSLDNWKEMKDLHGYFKNHSTISGCASDLTKSNCHLYCNYVKYISELYKKYLKDCCVYYYSANNVVERDCPSYFLCDKTYNPYALLSKLKCDDRPTREEIETVYDEAIIDRKAKLITEKYNRSYEPHTTQMQQIWQNLFQAYGALKTEPEYDSFRFNMSIAFGILGAFFTFFVFYKFTPFGAWINRKVTNERRITNYYENNVQDMLRNQSEHTGINPQSRRVRIAYHSA
ncbi:Plasmodium vivax Vir protein, putative [Plasmodium vivax]|uniref:Vir protein, putative n=1 Tax=Plasmodium vivax TaxID=5855 RepID=A0A1G4GT84_PLAVI|nr:Plasmodium vivax Vir protein, putative [Plasmodium vivax]